MKSFYQITLKALLRSVGGKAKFLRSHETNNEAFRALALAQDNLVADQFKRYTIVGECSMQELCDFVDNHWCL